MHRKLDLRRTSLYAAPIAAVCIAMAIGLVSPSQGRAQSVSDVIVTRGGTAPPQAPASGPLSFEVASIKPSAPEASGMRRVMIGMSPGGRYTATGVTVKMLLQQAYGVKDYQLSGLPGWAGTERYDINAKAEEKASQEQIKLMLQSLLAERFQLTLHRETKELPVYALVVGKNGPQLKESDPNAQPMLPGGPGAPGAMPPPPPPGVGGGGSAGGGAMGGSVSVSRAGGGEGGGPAKVGAMMRMGRGQLSAQMAPVSMIAAQLSQQLGRPVIDKTGLTGNYDFKLEWTPDEGQRGIGLGEGDRPSEAAPIDSSGPSIFTAVQEQLGLKLEAQKGPVEILVIDRVEKPSEN